MKYANPDPYQMHKVEIITSLLDAVWGPYTWWTWTLPSKNEVVGAF